MDGRTQCTCAFSSNTSATAYACKLLRLSGGSYADLITHILVQFWNRQSNSLLTSRIFSDSVRPPDHRLDATKLLVCSIWLVISGRCWRNRFRRLVVETAPEK